MTQQRIQKILARAGVASRRGAEVLIVAGRVRIDGKIETQLGSLVDPDRQKVEVDGRRIVLERPAYLVFHKPRGVMCTMSDPQGRPTVKDYIDNVGVRVVPVGRLDFHTSGVLLLTNDGDLSKLLTHPSTGVTKLYRVKLQAVVDDHALEKFRASISIDGRRTVPARVSRIRDEGDKSWLLVALHEGRNRQIRRLAEHAGHRVTKLVRISFGGITTDGLKSGGWRQLSESEVRSLKSGARPTDSPNASNSSRPRSKTVSEGPRSSHGSRPQRSTKKKTAKKKTARRR